MGKLSQAIAHNAQLLQVQGNFDDCLEIARELAAQLPGAPGQLGQPRPHRGPEDGGVRGRRGARRRARLPLHPGRQRRQLHGVLPRLHAKRLERGASTKLPAHVRLPGRGQRAARARPRRQEPRHDRQRDPHRQPGIVGPRARRRATTTDGYFGAIDDDRHPRRAPHPLGRGRHLRRARLGDQRRRTARAQRGRRHPGRARPSCSP